MLKEVIDSLGLSFGRLQDIKNVLTFLKSHGVSGDDLITYVNDTLQERSEHAKRIQENTPKCPDCGTTLLLAPVNMSPGDQTGDDSKSLWYCIKCDYESYSLDSVETIIKDLTKKKKKKE